MDTDRKIKAFSHLGKILKAAAGIPKADFTEEQQQIYDIIMGSEFANAWFTPEFTRQSVDSIAEMLTQEMLREWIGMYALTIPEKIKTVAVVMAVNVPAVGFHDILSVLMAGHKIQAKLSSDDKKLIPAMSKILISFDQDFTELIEFTDDKIHDFDAVIATGSNNTARYFDYYFGKYPHII